LQIGARDKRFVRLESETRRRMMNWSPQTMTAMHSWLASAASYEWGPHEDDKLYMFVTHVWHDQHSVWDEARTREMIRNKARELGDDPDSAHVSGAIQKGLSHGTRLLEFLTWVENSGNISLLEDSAKQRSGEKESVQ
jgi:hypothetical protein